MRQKQDKRIRLGPISKGILGLVATGAAVSMLAIAPGLTVAMAPFLKKKKYRSRQAINKNVDALIKNGLIKKKINGKGEPSLYLTAKGRWEAGIRGLNINEKNEKQNNKKWDGLWRVIVFDVPESKRNVRYELRRAINLYGFKQLQKSVWVYPYPCDDFVQLAKSYLGISHDVLYMKVNYLENDKYLKQEFKLKKTDNT